MVDAVLCPQWCGAMSSACAVCGQADSKYDFLEMWLSWKVVGMFWVSAKEAPSWLLYQKYSLTELLSFRADEVNLPDSTSK